MTALLQSGVRVVVTGDPSGNRWKTVLRGAQGKLTPCCVDALANTHPAVSCRKKLDCIDIEVGQFWRDGVDYEVARRSLLDSFSLCPDEVILVSAVSYTVPLQPFGRRVIVATNALACLRCGRKMLFVLHYRTDGPVVTVCSFEESLRLPPTAHLLLVPRS